MSERISNERIRQAYDKQRRGISDTEEKILEYYDYFDEIGKNLLEAQNDYKTNGNIDALYDKVSGIAEDICYMAMGNTEATKPFLKLGILKSSRKKTNQGALAKKRIFFSINAWEPITKEKPYGTKRLPQFFGEKEKYKAYRDQYHYSFDELVKMLDPDETEFSERTLKDIVYQPKWNYNPASPGIKYTNTMRFANLIAIAYKNSIADEIRDFFKVPKNKAVDFKFEYTIKARGYFISMFFRDYGALYYPRSAFSISRANKSKDYQGEFPVDKRQRAGKREDLFSEKNEPSMFAAKNEATNYTSWSYINIGLLRVLRYFILESIRDQLSLWMIDKKYATEAQLKEEYEYQYKDNEETLTYKRSFEDPFYNKPPKEDIKILLSKTLKVNLEQEVGPEEEEQFFQEDDRRRRTRRDSVGPDTQFQQTTSSPDIERLTEELRKLRQFEKISDDEIITKLRRLARPSNLPNGGDPEFQQAFVLLVRKLALE